MSTPEVQKLDVKKELVIEEHIVQWVCKGMSCIPNDQVNKYEASGESLDLCLGVSAKADGMRLMKAEQCVLCKETDSMILCPACDKTFTGGRRRLSCLYKHVSAEHKVMRVKIFKYLKGAYGSRKVCPCDEWN